MRAAAGVALAVLALGGCGGSDGPPTKPGPPKPAPAGGAAVIRGWTQSMYRGDFDRAARYFAKDAIVQQVQTIVLRTHEDAVSFGRSLPCRAKVISIKREPKGVLLASFDLFPGIGGTCPTGGSARVRFFINHGLIETWRQLPDAPRPPGQSV
ncbi:MAG: hypothetical protein QOF55_849 [Thermoleophilaceae bacterium]|nr:hypothetical protein [Thermoleophilaceae bacterium]